MNTQRKHGIITASAADAVVTNPSPERIGANDIGLAIVIPELDLHIDNLVSGGDVRKLKNRLKRSIGHVPGVIDVHLKINRTQEAAHRWHAFAFMIGADTKVG